MGYVFEEITLKNSTDVSNAMSGIINEREIRQKTVEALVDTGCFTMVIDEELCRELGLRIVGEREVSLADNTTVICKEAEPVDIHWKNRSTSMRPGVLPETDKILLGALPLQNMDLIVDAKNEKLIGAHGDRLLFRV